jgi:hypothetical protein
MAAEVVESQRPAHVHAEVKVASGRAASSESGGQSGS